VERLPPVVELLALPYDPAGNQTSFTDALSHTTQYAYDDAGMRTKTIYPDQSTDSVTYDFAGPPDCQDFLRQLPLPEVRSLLSLV